MKNKIFKFFLTIFIISFSVSSCGDSTASTDKFAQNSINQKLFTRIFFFALIIRIILSWIKISPYNPISRITYQITEPVLGKIRQYVKPFGMFDFSPMIAIIGMQIPVSYTHLTLPTKA